MMPAETIRLIVLVTYADTGADSISSKTPRKKTVFPDSKPYKRSTTGTYYSPQELCSSCGDPIRRYSAITVHKVYLDRYSPKVVRTDNASKLCADCIDLRTTDETDQGMPIDAVLAMQNKAVNPLKMLEEMYAYNLEE